MSIFADLLKGLNLDQYGRGKPPGSWRKGGPGDHDWETMNSQMLHEWLRWHERMLEFVQKRGTPHWDWRTAQVHKFKALLAERYDGQTYPAPDFVQLYEDRVAERHGPEAVELFRDKWRQCS